MSEKPALPHRDRLYDWIRRVRPLIYAGCFIAFLHDVAQTDTLAFGILYVPLVATALVSSNRRNVWLLAIVAILMNTAGAFLPEINADLFTVLGNRLLSILAIVVTALCVRHAQEVQDRLAEQTRRAEEAERLKTAFFTHLGYDMRVPLHAIIGLSQLMKLDCAPRHRDSLTHVQSSTRQLLGTIDNLIDITEIGTRPFRRERLDLTAILRRAVADIREAASERQIGVGLHMTEFMQPVEGDRWAAKRIIDNILANAVRFTPPGGKVTISMTSRDAGVIVQISDTGPGIPPGVLDQSGEPVRGDESAEDCEHIPVGTGLALSRQLAPATGADLQFESTSFGTTVTIRFRGIATERDQRPELGARA